MFKRFGSKILAFLLTFSIGFTPLKGDTMAAGAAVGGPPGAVVVVGAAAAIAYAQHRKNARQTRAISTLSKGLAEIQQKIGKIKIGSLISISGAGIEMLETRV